MDPKSFRISHRQLVSAILSLVTSTDIPGVPAYLAELGYELHSVELPMVDVHGRTYTPDLFVTNLGRHNVLLIDCKTWGPVADDLQISKYMRTSSQEVITQSGITPIDPTLLTSDAMFFVMSGGEGDIAGAVARCSNHRINGFGIVAVSPTRIDCPHNELTDDDLSQSLDKGWEVNLQDLPLERLPYEPTCPDWELADAVFQTVFSMFIEGVRDFTIDDICVRSNELWPYLHAFHVLIRKRISHEFRRIAKVALKDWVRAIRDETNVVTRWAFKKPETNRKDVYDGFKRRQTMYIDIRLQKRDPVAADFENIDAGYDQKMLTTVEGDPIDFGGQVDE